MPWRQGRTTVSAWKTGEAAGRRRGAIVSSLGGKCEEKEGLGGQRMLKRGSLGCLPPFFPLSLLLPLPLPLLFLLLPRPPRPTHCNYCCDYGHYNMHVLLMTLTLMVLWPQVCLGHNSATDEMLPREISSLHSDPPNPQRQVSESATRQVD